MIFFNGRGYLIKPRLKGVAPISFEVLLNTFLSELARSWPVQNKNRNPFYFKKQLKKIFCIEFYIILFLQNCYQILSWKKTVIYRSNGFILTRFDVIRSFYSRVWVGEEGCRSRPSSISLSFLLRSHRRKRITLTMFLEVNISLIHKLIITK